PAGEPRAGAARTGPRRGAAPARPGCRRPAARLPPSGTGDGLLPGAEVPRDCRHPGHPGRHGEVAAACGPGQTAGGVERHPQPLRGLTARGPDRGRAMHPMDDNLVGYLLDALDAESRRAVDDYLHTDPEARRRLDHLRRLLEPLEADGEPPAPP